jgi:hypothetical protein
LIARFRGLRCVDHQTVMHCALWLIPLDFELHRTLLANLTLSGWLGDNVGPVLAGAIVVFGLLIYGLQDTLGFSLRRARAIAGVCFDESLRRRVLWVTPLAILGLVIVCQLQHPVDEQDAIRQTAKFCVFATGLVVVMTSLILACTNLPREIESRVIFTIVTKPATRLEIVVGKVMGFASVSATILLIMGLFTGGYLQVRSWSLSRSVESKLATQSADASMVATLEHYKTAGLLTARTLVPARHMQLLATEPTGEGGLWALGQIESVDVPFLISPQLLTPPDDPSADPTSTGLIVRVDLPYALTAKGKAEQAARTHPMTALRAPPPTVAAPSTPPGTPSATEMPPAAVFVSILDADQHVFIQSSQFQNSGLVVFHDPTAQHAVYAYLPPEQAGFLVSRMPAGGLIYVEVGLGDDAYKYLLRPGSVRLLVPPRARDAAPRIIEPLADISEDLAVDAGTAAGMAAPPDSDETTEGVAPVFHTMPSMPGYQLAGSADESAPVAVYSFRNVHPHPAPDGTVPFELEVGVERGNDESESFTTARIDVFDAKHTRRTFSTNVYPDAGRTLFFSVPADALAGGDFDLSIRCISPSQYLGVTRLSVYAVTVEETYLWNLFKSLLVLWLMSLMVIIVAVCCSTFVSWPIALVLSLVILLGHWGVTQLADSLSPGLGRQVLTDLFGGSAGSSSTTQSISASIDALAKSVSALGAVLPDISQFSAVDDLQRGVSLPMSRLIDALWVLGLFGLPGLVISYVLLRNKEVAP